MPRTELSSTLATVAPGEGGRTTRPCSMPGTRTLCTNSNWPVDHRAHVHARHGRAEHRPLARVLARGFRVELDVERPAANQRAVGHRA